MAGSRRVQSASNRVTFLASKSASTSWLASVVFLLYWQVTHQAAVKSTNTGTPLASTCSTRPGSHVCHRAALVVGPLFSRGLMTFWPIVDVNSARVAIELSL